MSVSNEKMIKEAEAHKKRTEALKFLETKGQSVGPISIKQIEENKNKADNTLSLLLKEKAQNLSKGSSEKSSKFALLKQQNESREEFALKTSNALTAPLKRNWKEVPDVVSKKSYYWNTVTNETTWDRPIEVENMNDYNGLNLNTSRVDDLPPNWIEKTHAATKQSFYQNTVTGKTSFTRPVVEKTVVTTIATANAPSSSTTQQTTLSGNKNKLSDTTFNNDSKRLRSVDPLDPTKGKGLGNGPQDGSMADSTASGPLWQQR
jgi:hypothetical protein